MSQITKRLKYVCHLGYGDALTQEIIGSEFPVFGSNGIYASSTRANTKSPAIIIGRKGSYGKINWSEQPCFASDTTFFVDETLTKEDLRWLFWVLQTLGLDEGSNEAAVPGVNRETVYEKKVIVPKINAQRYIAQHLDSETAQIDSLINEKEKMLSLLAEKRTALISQAVTKGLDPDAPMRPSGILWLGEIPAHWEIRKLKKVFNRIETGGTPSTMYMENPEEANFTWFTPIDFNSSGYLRESKRKIPKIALELGQTKLFPKNSLLIIGIGATLGKVGLSEVECSTNQQINILIGPTGVDAQYVLHVLSGYEIVLKAHSNSATLPILNQERLGEIAIPVPPLLEQQKISDYCSMRLRNLTPLFDELRKSVFLLKERRSALITAAVTGQIKITETPPAKEVQYAH